MIIWCLRLTCQLRLTEIILKVTRAWSPISKSRVLTSIYPKLHILTGANGFSLQHPRWVIMKICSLTRLSSNGLIISPLWDLGTRTQKVCHTYISAQLIKRRCKLIYAILSSIFSNREGRIKYYTKKFIITSCRELSM